MSKLILPTLGLGGAGAAGFGAYMLIPRDTEITFKVKYKNAILNPTGDESLWNSKFTSLSGKTVKHAKLQSAVTQYSSNSTNAKALHKEACQDIYNSPAENSEYQKDFQDYCAKNLKDQIGGKWISEEKSGNKWNARLTSLKSHESSKGELDATLNEIKTSLSGDSNNTFDDTKRGKLKDWCTSAGAEIFNSIEDARFKLVKLYCSEP